MPIKTRRRGFTPEQTEAYRKAARKPAGWMLESRLADTPSIAPEAIPEGHSGKPAASKPGATIVRKMDLTDTKVGAAVDFAEGGAVLLHDHGGTASVPGLRIRLGKRSATWLYYSDRLIHGERKIVSETLGSFPAMTTTDARRAAAIWAGRYAAKANAPGQRAAVKLSQATDEYLDHLRRQAAKRGKPARWAKNVTSLVKHFDKFLNWPLAELSDAPADVAVWHRKITKDHGPVTANQAAKIMRAAYRRAARLDRSLPPGLPTSAVEFNEEHRSQKALAFGDFPKWQKAWQAIETPTRKAFQRLNLLCGARPGELSRLKWADVLPRERRFVIRDPKMKDDISVPLTVPMVRELRRARDAARADNIKSPFVFYSRDEGHIVKFDHDNLPAHGMMLRRTYRTVAADLGIDELLTHFLQGHRPAGISRGYIAKMILASGGAMRKAQHDMSARIESLLAGRNGKH